MKDTETIIEDDTVLKRAVNKVGHDRLLHEKFIYERLSDSAHVAHVLLSDDDSLTLERINGINAKTWLDFEENWTCAARPWGEVEQKLGRYVAAEMDFLEHGVMYRDLNLEHLIFSGDKAMLIDLEEAVIKDAHGRWHFDSRRGTWETMALEEFPAYGELTERTATYRVAVIAHLALTGRLPFPRKPVPIRKTTYVWRKNHPARIDNTLPHSTRKVFNAALSREPARRHKNPAVFWQKLTETYIS